MTFTEKLTKLIRSRTDLNAIAAEMLAFEIEETYLAHINDRAEEIFRERAERRRQREDDGA